MIKKIFDLKDNRTSEISKFTTMVVATLTDTEINFEFFCKDSMLYSAYEGYNTNIYEGDVCEVFISTDGTTKNYYEIEVAPNGSVFLHTIYNPNNTSDVQIKPVEENFLKTDVEILGSDYIVKISIPLDKIGYSKENGILFNAFRIETEGGIMNKNLLAYSPSNTGTFHISSFFKKF